MESEIYHNLGNYGIVWANPIIGNAASTQINECNINKTKPLINVGPVSSAAYFGRSIFAERIRQGSSVSSPKSLYQNQVCE